MEIIRSTAAEVVESGLVTAYEYETSSETMNLARIRVNGRYPKSGFTSNSEVDALVHIIDGQGTLIMQDGTQLELAAHDQVHLTAGDAYAFAGNLELLYAATPKWTSEQTRYID